MGKDAAKLDRMRCFVVKGERDCVAARCYLAPFISCGALRFCINPLRASFSVFLPMPPSVLKACSRSASSSEGCTDSSVSTVDEIELTDGDTEVHVRCFFLADV